MADLDPRLLLSVAAPYLALEAAWFAAALPWFYSGEFARAQNLRRWSPRGLGQSVPIALFAYAVLVSAVARLGLGGDPRRVSYLRAAADGAYLGFVVYGTYNLTNLAALSSYSWRLAAVDTCWGVFVMAAACAAAKWLYGRWAGPTNPWREAAPSGPLTPA